MYRIGADIGGTFTDVVCLASDGRMITAKVPSTTGDYSRGIVNGLRLAMERDGLLSEEVTGIVHGTTVATNTLLEHKGARTGLITTEGFRDVLEIRRLRMPRLYDIGYRKPETLVPRALRLEVSERLDHQGIVLSPLDEASAEAAIDTLFTQRVEAIAICLMNAYANGDHEQRLLEMIRKRDADIPVTLSSEILPEIREYERTSTAVVNAYVMPEVASYLQRLSKALREETPNAPVQIMQSNGGVLGLDEACRKPVNLIESGPAAGVVGAEAVARKLGYDDVLTFDMGGTTAKASLISNGHYAHLGEMEVGAGINAAGRMMKGGGYYIRVPAIDLAEVGTGGGSIIRLDAGGAVKIGPDSAGAEPGPVAYDRGGSEPTITDANILLGYLNPNHLVGGEVALNRSLAEEVMQDRIAGPLGLSVADAAFGVHTLADAEMARALNAVSSERGRNPREYAMLAFGGNGPLHGASLAETLGITTIILPPASGVFSALGLLFPDAEHHLSVTCKGMVNTLDDEVVSKQLSILEGNGQTTLSGEGFEDRQMSFEHLADLRYKGQSSDLTVPLMLSDPNWRDVLMQAFHDEHEQIFGYASPEEQVEIINLRVVARAISDEARIPERLSAVNQTQSQSAFAEREAYFGPDHGWHSVTVLPSRTVLNETPKEGPLIIEEYDTTIVVPPGWTICAGDFDSVIMNKTT